MKFKTFLSKPFCFSIESHHLSSCVISIQSSFVIGIVILIAFILSKTIVMMIQCDQSIKAHDLYRHVVAYQTKGRMVIQIADSARQKLSLGRNMIKQCVRRVNNLTIFLKEYDFDKTSHKSEMNT
jgi:hypothetical protein